MTTKRKIKKWHIVVLIILGISSNWLSQNMWVFEKQILVGDYEELLSGTKWIAKERGNTKEFKSNGEFLQLSIDRTDTRFDIEGEWSFKNGNELNIKYEGKKLVSIYKINFVTENYIEIQAIFPPIPSTYKTLLKKINEN